MKNTKKFLRSKRHMRVIEREVQKLWSAFIGVSPEDMDDIGYLMTALTQQSPAEVAATFDNARKVLSNLGDLRGAIDLVASAVSEIEQKYCMGVDLASGPLMNGLVSAHQRSSSPESTININTAN